jgi:transposase
MTAVLHQFVHQREDFGDPSRHSQGPEDRGTDREERGRELVYLPPYSPDLNPIEEAFSKVKQLLRETEARTRKGLIEAMAVVNSAVTAQDAHGFFEHCGYRIPIQLS